MSELFELKTTNETYVNCDCRTQIKNKKKVSSPNNKQPLVKLQRSVDDRYLVGTCLSCSKIHTKEVA